MKLKAFSQNNPLRHLILSTVKRYFWLPLVMLLLTGVGFLGFEMNRPDFLELKKQYGV